MYGGPPTIYTNDVIGSKPNPDAETIFVDMGVWNEIFEPILIGMNLESPTNIQYPKLNDLLGDKFELTVDEV